MTKMKDSGQRETFESGAVRDSDEGKPHPEYISPFAMERLAQWLTEGAKKYTARNWEKGLGIERCFSSMYRHLLKYQMGEHDEDHIAAIFCNCMMILHYEEMVRRGLLPSSLLDMPKYRQPSSYYDQARVVVDKDGPKVTLEAEKSVLCWTDDGEV